MGIPKGQVKVHGPGRMMIAGSFGAHASLDERPSLDCALHTTNLTSIIEDINQEPVAERKQVTCVGDAVYADAVLDMGPITGPEFTSVLTLAPGAIGAAGNGWEICLLGSSPAGVFVYDDLGAGVTYIMYRSGVSDGTDLDNAILAYGGVLGTSAAGGALALTAPGHDHFGLLMAGGADQETVEDDGDLQITLHFEDGATTEAEMEAAIVAYTAAGGLLQVQTAGGGAAALTVPADEFADVVMEPGHIPTIEGTGFTAFRSDVGEYTVRLNKLFPALESADACLQLATADEKFTQIESFTQNTGELIINIWDVTGAARQDIAINANNRINFNMTLETFQ